MGSSLPRLPVKLVLGGRKNTALISFPPSLSRSGSQQPNYSILLGQDWGAGCQEQRLGHLLFLHPQEMTWFMSSPEYSPAQELQTAGS